MIFNGHTFISYERRKQYQPVADKAGILLAVFFLISSLLFLLPSSIRAKLRSKWLQSRRG